MSTRRAACAECRNLIGGYVLDALEPDEMKAVSSHLAACPDCAAEHARLAEIPALLAVAGSDENALEAPPAALEEAVLDRFAREHRDGPTRRPLRERLAAAMRPLRRPLPAALAGALAAAVALGVTLGAGDSNHAGWNGDTYQAYLSGSAAAPRATAFARLSTFSAGTRVWLKVNGLRGNPDDLYELWCVRDDGSKISAGTFRVDAHGNAAVDLTTGAVPGEYHRLSVERKPPPTERGPGSRVMTGDIQFSS